MPTLTIDNRQITVTEGTTILQAAEEMGIIVPHFCYHQALGAVGACRMCAVTVVKGTFPGLRMACLVAAEEGMVVTTGDEKATHFRERVGEWLMLNHPHDCPVCDEGGECQLQEMTIASGHGIRRYRGRKRTYANQQLGPYVSQEMNRCIQCYRCVRTYQDYCGGRDFGVMGSRNRVFFGRFEDGPLESDFSGNIVDVCPTGVFTDKTYRFKTRFWDLQEAESICPHCSLGCLTIPGGRYRELQRVRSGSNPEVNDCFICDRGRFGGSYVNHPERPRQARSGEQQLSIEDALDQLADQVRTLTERHGPEAVLLFGSSRASLETNWLLQQWAQENGLLPPQIAAREQHSAAQVAAFDLSDRLASLAQIRSSDLVMVFGADPLAEAPMLAVALRQVARNGGQVLVYDPRPVELPCEFDHVALSPIALLELLGNEKNAETVILHELLQKAARPVLVGGGDLLGGSGLAKLNQLAKTSSNAARPCLVHPLLAGPNSFGAALLSSPDEQGLLARLETGQVKMLICMETDLLQENSISSRFADLLTNLQALVVFDYLPTPLSQQASLFIPTCAPPETAGSFINNEGRLQQFLPVLEPGLPIAVTGAGVHPPREFSNLTPGSEPLPAWVLLQQLRNELPDLLTIRQQLVNAQPRLTGLTELAAGAQGVRVGAAEQSRQPQEKLAEQPEGSLQLLLAAARYGGDPLSRYSEKLAPRSVPPRLSLHPDDAKTLGLDSDRAVVLDCEAGSLHLPLQLNESQARGCALVENAALHPLLVPGGKLSYCHVSQEVRDV